MKEFWNMIQLIITAMGGWLGYFLGGCDGLLIALIVDEYYTRGRNPAGIFLFNKKGLAE